MKKLLLILLIAFLAFTGFLLLNDKKEIKKLELENTVIDINKMYIYGTHLNMEGSNLPDEELDLILYNGNFLSYNITKTDSNFSISEYVNDGLYLEKIENGNYYMFLRNTIDEEKNEYKYYALNNNTEYKETVYYTMSSKNKKVTIKNEETYPTIMITVEENTEDEIYDIVLDPGHGGRDPGATRYGYKETDFTLKLAEKVKAILEENNIKVKLTREEDTLTDKEKLPEYGVHGRAVMPREVNAKYLFSFHLNSNAYSTVNGLEIYTPANINYNYARFLVDKITTGTGLKTSNNKIHKVEDGIYTREFTESDVKESIDEYVEADLNPYEVSTRSNYYYIIRETGGIVTGAYVDDRNESVSGNPYFNSNVGTETYLLELGYITSRTDLDNIINNIDKYASTIAEGIQSLFLETSK